MLVADIAFWYGLILLALLAGLTLRLVMMSLTGQVRLDGLMRASGAPSSPVDPERVALIALTFAAAGYYVLTVLGTPVDSLVNDAGAHSLPDMPDAVLVALGLSQSSYLGLKIARLFPWKGLMT